MPQRKSDAKLVYKVRADGTVDVRGPREFIEQIDKQRLRHHAEVYADYVATADDAIRLAIAKQYKEWLATKKRGAN